MFKKSIVAIFGMMALLTAFSASAQSYMGTTIGSSRLDADCEATTACDKKDSSYKIYWGTKISPALDVEVSYFDLGQAKMADEYVTASFKASGADVAGVMRTSLNQDFSLFAKAGAAYVRAETFASVGSVSGSLEKSSFQPMVGVGMTYKISDVFRARADVDYHRVKFSDGPGAHGDVTSLSIGAEAKF